MNTFFRRNRIKLFMVLFFSLACYGLYLSLMSKETKDIVTKGVQAQNATIKYLVAEKQAAQQKAIETQKVVALVKQADDSVLLQKQLVIDSLTQKIPNEATVPDPDISSPDAVFSYLSDYKPAPVALAPGDTLY